MTGDLPDPPSSPNPPWTDPPWTDPPWTDPAWTDAAWTDPAGTEPGSAVAPSSFPAPSRDDQPLSPAPLRAPAASARGSKRALAIGIVLAVVVALVTLSVLLTRGGSGSGIDGGRAADGFAAVIAGTDFVDGTAGLARCPAGELDDLVALIDDTLGLDPAVMAGDDALRAYAESPDLPASFFCNQFAADPAEVASGPTAISIAVTGLPAGDYAAYLAGLFEGSDYTGLAPTTHRGGQVYAYCVEAVVDGGQTGCGADWVDDDAAITIGVYLEGDDETDDTAVDALMAVLAPIAANLSDLA